MSSVLNNITAPDQFTDAATVIAPGSSTVLLSVSNQAIYWRRGFGAVGGAINWSEPEEFLPPGLFELSVSCDAVSVRAAVPAAELPPPLQAAQVTVKLS